MSSTIAPGAPSVIEIKGNGVTARATIALATVTRRGVWNARMTATAIAEKKRVKKLREQYSAEEWPGLHAAPGDEEVFTTPEGIEASAALCTQIIDETLQSLRLTHDDGTVEQIDRAGAAFAIAHGEDDGGTAGDDVAAGEALGSQAVPGIKRAYIGPRHAGQQASAG